MSTPLRMVLVEVLEEPADRSLAESTRALNVANAWLQRRAAGTTDALLFVGINWTTEALRAAVNELGLDEAACKIASVLEGDDLGQEAAFAIETWLDRNHQAAVPVLVPPKVLGARYPCDMWWYGVEATEEGELADAFADAVGSSFSAQAATWEALLSGDVPFHAESDADGFRRRLALAGLARWLAGFDAASENTFFDFDYRSAVKGFGMDLVRLGFEAAREGDEACVGDLEETDDDAVAAVCLKALLSQFKSYTGDLADLLCGSTGVLYSLYTSIWPDFSRPASEVSMGLVDPDSSELGERLALWRFVDEGDWSVLEDEG